MQAHMPRQSEPNLAIIKFDGADHYELHRKDDVSKWSEVNEGHGYRVVMCVGSHEMRILMKTAQFNLFEGPDDADPETDPQAR
jgi:hypothetical protein